MTPALNGTDECRDMRKGSWCKAS